MPENLAWEALVKATGANPHMNRGQIAIALQAIKAAWESDGRALDELPAEIESRAQAYRAMWPMLTLTPTALATHWYRVQPRRNPVDEWRDRFDT